MLSHPEWPSWPVSKFGVVARQFCGLFVMEPTKSTCPARPAAESWSQTYDRQHVISVMESPKGTLIQMSQQNVFPWGSVQRKRSLLNRTCAEAVVTRAKSPAQYESFMTYGREVGFVDVWAFVDSSQTSIARSAESKHIMVFICGRMKHPTAQMRYASSTHG